MCHSGTNCRDRRRSLTVGSRHRAIWGLSDGDFAWWCYESLVRSLESGAGRPQATSPRAPDSGLPSPDSIHWLDALALTSGLHPEDRDELWPLFDEACRSTPQRLVQHGWDIAERFTHAALTAHGVTIDAEGFRLRPRPQAEG